METKDDIRSSSPSISDTVQKIYSLDLSRIRRKIVCDPPEGLGWSEAQAEEAELWYKRFLHVYSTDQDSMDNVPSLPVDAFWHFHILDTVKYARDCQYVFGHFVHHNPYYGMNGDSEERDRSFLVTDNKYIELFGESCLSMKHFWFGVHDKLPGKKTKQNFKLQRPKIKKVLEVRSKCGPGGSCNTATT